MGRRTRKVLASSAALALLVLAGCGDDDDDAGFNPNNPPPGPSSDPNEPPVANVDHWHAAYGFYVCGEWQPDLPENEVPGGNHTHGDGVVHIHPFAESRSGPNATLTNFLTDAEVTLTDDELRIDDQEWVEGETDCDGQDAELVVAMWQDVQCSDDSPALASGDFDRIRFRDDGEGFTIAVVPEGETEDIPKPESAATLAELGALDSAPSPDSDKSPCG